MPFKPAWSLFSSFIILFSIGLLLWSPNTNVVAGLHTQPPEKEADVVVSQPVEPGISPNVRDLPRLELDPVLDREINPRKNPDLLGGVGENIVGAPDPLRQQGLLNRAVAPKPMLNFEGQGINGGTPPDTVGDVGSNHYVQMINTSFAMYNKSGQLLQGPHQINQLWQKSKDQSICGSQNTGDPIVLYDQLAKRWLLSQLARPNHLCIAISQTTDPTGSYYTYQFDVQQFPDYFKLSAWSDGYYMSANESTYTAYAFDRAKMLAGQAATFHKVGGAPNFMLPSDVDGTTPPPDGSPNFFYTFQDNQQHKVESDQLEVRAFTVDWQNPNNSSFTLVATIPITSFTYSVCGHFQFDCIPQAKTTQKVDPVSEWPMWRAQYRHFEDYETLVGNFTVDVGNDQAGIRWFELRKSGNERWALHQEGTYAPDETHRWMGSIAMDQSGNIALGYSASSESSYPSIGYATRLQNHPLGRLGNEETLISGTGSQTDINRWGDYSSLNVDPADDCTFWYTNQYFSLSGAGWRTRIGTFKLPSCQGESATATPTKAGPLATLTPIPTATPTATLTPTSLANLCRTPYLMIPDGNTIGVTDQLEIADFDAITDLNVSLNVTHEWVGDLIFTLEHVDRGTTVRLVDRPGTEESSFGCPEDDLNAILDDEAKAPIENACTESIPSIEGTFKPEEALSAFKGHNLSGSWRLTASDAEASYEGVLNEWCLLPSTSGSLNSPTPTPAVTAMPTVSPTATATASNTATASPTATQTPSATPSQTTDDLFAYDYQLWSQPTTLRAGSPSSLGLLVHRQGGISTLPSVSVWFWLGEPNAGGTLIDTSVVPSLAPDSSQNTTEVSWLPPGVGEYTIYAVIDPNGKINEANEENNTVRRTITVLPAAEDSTAPTVDELLINAGAMNTTNTEINLSIRASDPSNPAPATGVQALFIIEYEYKQSAAGWVPVQLAPNWQAYDHTPTTLNWDLSPIAGIKFLQAWAADMSGNISLSAQSALINHIPSSDTLSAGRSRIYVYHFSAEQQITARIIPLNGDPDLYIWPSSTANPPYSFNGAGEVDEITFIAPQDGTYIIEVYAFDHAEYAFTLDLNSTPQTSSHTANKGEKTARTEPALAPDEIPTSLEHALPPAPTISLTPTPTVEGVQLYLPVIIR